MSSRRKSAPGHSGPAKEVVGKQSISFRDQDLARKAKAAAKAAGLPFTRWVELVLAKEVGHKVTPTLAHAHTQEPLDLGETVDKQIQAA
ncbi:hypothetical protein [Sphaerisporangium album]|nr:hypothetical protein [Sphaerisporangium album]